MARVPAALYFLIPFIMSKKTNRSPEEIAHTRKMLEDIKSKNKGKIAEYVADLALYLDDPLSLWDYDFDPEILDENPNFITSERFEEFYQKHKDEVDEIERQLDSPHGRFNFSRTFLVSHSISHVRFNIGCQIE